MNTNIILVPYHNQTLMASMIAGVPHVAMKPICENIGLDWDAQRQKINRHPILSKGKVMITAPSNGGLQEMLMLPIKMLNGWLFGIDSSRVKESIKDVVISYQEECFDVLAEHFMSKNKTTALIEPPTITKAQEGILFNKVKDISGGSGKIRAELWSRFQNHYNLSSYKNLPANQYEDAVQYLEAKQKEYFGHGVEMFYISSKEIEERAKSLAGELVEKPEAHQHNSITINLAPLVDFKHRRWLVTQALDEMTIVMALTSDQEVKSKEQFIDDLIKEGYIVIKKDELLGRLEA